MEQWESEQELLKAQYRTMMTRIKEIRDEEKRNATARANQRSEELKDAMAREFKRYQDAGMPKYMMQDVIGTRDWSRWKDFERRGMLKSASQIRSAAKEQRELANAHFLWNDDYTVLTIQRGIDGAVLETPVEVSNIRIQLRVMTGGIYKPYWAWNTDPDLDREMSKQYPYKWHGYVTAELDRAAEAGELIRKTPESPWD